jgi:ATP-dependent DNA helicase RecG
MSFCPVWRSVLRIIFDMDILVSENKGRWTTYHLNEHSPLENIPKVDTSAYKVDTSAYKVDTSASKVDTSDLEETRKRLPKSALEVKILKACTENYISLEEIAGIVNKNVKYLKNKVIPRHI